MPRPAAVDQPPVSGRRVGRSASVSRRPRSSGLGGGGRARRRVVIPLGSDSLRDRAQRLAVLLVQRAGRVGDVVLVAQRPHLDRDLGVAVARQVGEQVVLDLEAEVAAT